MKVKFKLIYLILIFTLVIQSISYPYLVSANNSDVNQISLPYKITSSIDQEITVYEDADLDSEKIHTLTFSEEFWLVKLMDNFSEISFYPENSSKLKQGFIETDYLLNHSSPKQDEKQNNNSDEEEELIQEDETSKPDLETDSSNEYQNLETSTNLDDELKEEITKVNDGFKVSVHKSSVELKEGIAVKDKTLIYQDKSFDSKTLKSYPLGTILKYYQSDNNWYQTGVYVNGVKIVGYIHKSHVEDIMPGTTLLEGIALKDFTAVYQRPSTKATARKTYPEGSILRFYEYSDNWYRTGVVINGVKHTGYIHKENIEIANPGETLLEGIALENFTHVYQRASIKSPARKTYPEGSILRFYEYSDNWYRTGVVINGVKHTGYIHKENVEIANYELDLLRGIALNNKTSVYQRASTKAPVRKTYIEGSILMYYPYSSNWFKTSVYNNGKKQTGYIHKSHVETLNIETQSELFGVSLLNRTNVYSKPGRSFNVLKSYRYGSVLRYKTFSKEWYQTTVIINGTPRTGYIHINDVGKPSVQTNLSGYAIKEKTYVYDKPFNNSKAIKGYSSGSILKFKTYANDWYEAVVMVNGEWITGYIRTGDISRINHYQYNYSFKQLVDIQMQVNPKSDGAGRIPASRGEVEFFANPNNFTIDSKEYFQFLVLSEPANLNATEVNNTILKGKGVLENKAQYFINAGKKFNINEAYLIAHALHETGNASSILANGVPVDKYGKVTRDKGGNIANTNETEHIVYNLYGYGAYDSCPIECGAKYAFDKGWFTIEDSIIGGASSIVSYINRGQNTLYKMRWNPEKPGTLQYATHVQWATAQTQNIYSIYQKLEEYNPIFEFPNFLNTPNFKQDKVFGSVQSSIGLRLRTGPGTSYAIIDSLPNLTVVQIIDSSPNGWYKVNLGDLTGWVSAQYLHLVY